MWECKVTFEVYGETELEAREKLLGGEDDDGMLALFYKALELAPVCRTVAPLEGVCVSE